MNNRLDTLLGQIRHLEKELIMETQNRETEYCYEVHAKTIQFTDAAKARHKLLRLSLHRFLLSSRFLVLPKVPVIWIRNTGSTSKKFADPIKTLIPLTLPPQPRRRPNRPGSHQSLRQRSEPKQT